MDIGERRNEPPPRRLARVKAWLAAIVRAIAPSRIFWRGASLAVLVAGLGLWLSAVDEAMTPASILIPAAIGAAAVLIAVLGTGLLILALAIFRRAPLHFRWAALTGLVLVAASFSLTPVGGWVLLAAIVLAVVIVAVAGGAIAVLLTGRWRSSGRFVRAATFFFAVASVGTIVAAGLWLGLGGPRRGEIADAAATAKVAAAPPSLADPAKKGTHAVKTLTYGSGTDLRRPEFGESAAIQTQAVDASKVLKGWKGIGGWARTKYWGFDAKRLPLNGRVWYPDGEGPFPLVLVVHGNHLAADFSDPGYEYLGELLASRGYIFVSVDENFLNSMETDLISELEKENNARGWLLLEHLRVWHEWNADEASPFFKKVDTERIALVGHSRGGEAVAHAAAFNRLPFNPDNALARFDYGYKIRSIVAIAPADAQYRPAGTRTPLSDINYFTIQGSYDSDVFSFMGLNQYDRVRFTGEGPWFKSAVYAHAANHGQFNTTWGAFDVGLGVAKRVINTAALLDAQKQRRVAEVYISAFLDCTLKDVAEYRRLFEDHRYGAAWLPDTIYLTQYADATMKPIATFDEDLDLSTATVASGKIAAEHLTLWREGGFPLRSDPNEDRAVFLGWDRGRDAGEPSYEIHWPSAAFALGERSVLAFSLADGNEDPTPDDEEGVDESEAAWKKKPRQRIDLSVELVDGEGHGARLPLSSFSLLQPQLETPYFKAKLLHEKALSEPIFQTFLFPLDRFQAASPEFQPASATKLRLVFDRTESGVVIFDQAAFGTAP